MHFFNTLFLLTLSFVFSIAEVKAETRYDLGLTQFSNSYKELPSSECEEVSRVLKYAFSKHYLHSSYTEAAFLEKAEANFILFLKQFPLRALLNEKNEQLIQDELNLIEKNKVEYREKFKESFKKLIEFNDCAYFEDFLKFYIEDTKAALVQVEASKTRFTNTQEQIEYLESTNSEWNKALNESRLSKELLKKFL
jgi:hypothetical protein